MFIEYKSSGIQVSLMANPTYPPHLHHSIELIVCINGCLRVSCGEREATLQRGDMMIAFSNDVHAYLSSSKGSGIMFIFDPSVLSLFENRLSHRRYENFLHSGDEKLVSCALAALEEYNSDRTFEILSGYICILLGTALKTLPYTDIGPTVESDLLLETLQYISEHYTEPISLKMLAKKCGVDPCHLSRTLSQKLPGGFLHYVQQLRTEYARELLRCSNLDVYNVACEAGFSNLRTFNRVFKTLTGMTPTAYRQQTQHDSTKSAVSV